MKLQVCSFKREKNSILEFGFAKVIDYDYFDVEWIIDENGNKVKTIWNYTLINNYPGALAYIGE